MSSWTSFLMCVTFLLNLYLDQSGAVQCYSCSYDVSGADSQHCQNPSSNTTTCDGKSCSLTSASASDSNTATARGCITGTTGTMCLTLNVFGYSTTTCACDGSLCNGVDISTLMIAAANKTSKIHTCYSCTYISGMDDYDNCQFPNDRTPLCTGSSCVSGNAEANGKTLIARACASGTVQTECYSTTTTSTTVKLCTCTSEMCNAASSHSPRIIPMAMIVTALYFFI